MISNAAQSKILHAVVANITKTDEIQLAKIDESLMRTVPVAKTA